jgi:hypothetical protein
LEHLNSFCTFHFPILQSNLSIPKADRAADIQRENAKKKRRELEQASMDAASDLLDTDSNATFAMVSI